MRCGVGVFAVGLSLWAAAGAAGLPGDAGEATRQQKAASGAERYAHGVGWLGGVAACQSSTFDCTTVWSDILGDKPPRLVVVRAGAERGRGSVEIETWVWDPWDTRGEAGPLSTRSYAAPASLGRLTIVAVGGSTMVLQTDAGQWVAFDLAARTYRWATTRRFGTH